MRILRLFFFVMAMAACADPGASLQIDEVRASRLPDGRVAVDVDVLAQERLGGSLGTYCAHIWFPDEPGIFEECGNDLEDGDRKTLRYTSKTNLVPGKKIWIELLVDRATARSTVLAP